MHKMNACNNVQANVIDGITGQDCIANYWKEHFYKILNANDCDPNLTADIRRKLQNVQHDSNMAVSAKSITEIVSKLECGKSAGPDGISAECFKFSDTKLHVLLSLLFSMCLSHGYLPSALIKTTIVPIVKNKAGDLSDSNNYRPIAIATITSKLLESVLLLKCSDYLTTCDNQFGFKASHGTDMCIYTLKEFIDYYKCRGTTVYVTFLDASKAFDRLNYWLLFDKLIKNMFHYLLLNCCFSGIHTRRCVFDGATRFHQIFL